MLYRVLIDDGGGVGEQLDDCMDFSDNELQLLTPKAEIELDAVGSLEFIIPPTHKYYNRFNMDSIMSMTLEVWEDNVQHWFGRPIELTLDFYKNKKIYCEGPMGYFNDSIQRAKEYEGVLLSSVFQDFINNHNNMVPVNRQFTVAAITIPDHEIYRNVDYERSSDVLKNKLLDSEDGHLFFERVAGINYISWLADDTWPYECNQTVKFGENMLNFSYSFDGKDFATCILPLGATVADTDEPLTIASVNGGSDILVGNAAANYGPIVRVESYGDIADPTELMSEAQKLLLKLQYNATVVECSAVDLHSKDSTKTPFRVGQLVACESETHGLSLNLPLSKLSLELDSAAKQITLGQIPKKNLARFYKPSRASSSGSGSSIVVSDVPSSWAFEEVDNELVAKKCPVYFEITYPPDTTEYASGDTIDYTGIRCRPLASTNPVTYFVDDRYLAGSYIPFAELSFSTNVMPSNVRSSSVLVQVRWPNPYKSGVTFVRTLELINTTKKAEEDDAETQHGGKYPNHIAVIATGLNLDNEFLVGQYIDTSGLRVKAYYPDGSEYDVDGYVNGRIPNTELMISPKKIIASSVDEPVNIPSAPTGTADGGGIHHNYGFASGTGLYCCWKSSSNVLHHFWASEDPNARWLDVGSGSGPLNNVITKAGQSVYYHGGDGLAWPTSDIQSSPAFYTGQNKNEAFVAWHLFHDGYSETINVSWKSPSGTVLSDSFDIKVYIPE